MFLKYNLSDTQRMYYIMRPFKNQVLLMTFYIFICLAHYTPITASCNALIIVVLVLCIGLFMKNKTDILNYVCALTRIF